MKDNKGFILNTIGSMIFSVFSAVILMTCTRMNGVEIAGIFSICYATGCILNAIGDLGIRIVQVTDTNRKFQYSEYLYARTIAVLAMLLFGIVFIIATSYTREKMFILVILLLIRVLDNFSETFQAEFQLQDRLDIAGKSLIYRNLAEILGFIVLNKITGNIYISFGGMLVLGFLVLVFYELRNVKKYQNIGMKYNYSKIKEIIKESVPLGISTLVSMYVINAVKYAIEKFNNNEIQTYFNILYMPTFVINLISILIVKPFLKVFGDYWNNGEYANFAKIILKLNTFLMVCGILGEIVCYFIGIPILNWLYKVDLSQYTFNLLIMILSGIFYAMSTVMFYAIGTMRKQKYTTLIYGSASIFALLVSRLLVKKDIMMGATISNLIIMIFLFVGLTSVFIVCLNKKNVKSGN